MAVIKYCDFTNGNDDTGDGTTGTPYKTITKASTGLSGGDEVRVAKSPADTALTGTLGFTAGSTAVTGSGTNFTGELVIGDFVKGGDGQYYEIVTITDNTNAFLFKVYPSTTGAGVTGYKLGVTSTGEAVATSTEVQTVSATGTSVASRLKISGGWDLTGPTQDGQTYFRQMHGTFDNRYGYGLYANSKDYIELERLHFLRYDRCIYMNYADYWLITSPNLLSAGDEAWYLSYCSNNEIITPVVNSSADLGVYLSSSSRENIITSLICNSNNSYGIRLRAMANGNTFTSLTCNYNDYGIYGSTSDNNTFNSLTCNNNSTYGIYGYQFCNNIFNSPTFNNNSSNGIYFYHQSYSNILNSPTCNDNGGYGIRVWDNLGNIVNNYSGSGNSSGDIYVGEGSIFSEFPAIQVQHFNTAGDNRCYYEYGVTYRDTVDARSTQCLKYDPTSATYYISQSFFFKADSGVEQTLSAYIKDDDDFNGDIQAAIYFMGVKITGWSEWTPTTSYVQKTIVAGAEDITEDGVLELRIKVRGTDGNVFVDDINTV